MCIAICGYSTAQYRRVDLGITMLCLCHRARRCVNVCLDPSLSCEADATPFWLICSGAMVSARSRRTPPCMWSWMLVPERGTLPHHFPSHAVSGPSPVVSRLLRAPPSLSTPQCPLLVVRSPPVCGCPEISGIRVVIDRDPAPGLPIGVLLGTSAPGCGRDRCHGCTSIIKVAASSGVPVVNDVSDSTRSKAGVRSLLRSVTSCPVCLSSVSFPLTQLVPHAGTFLVLASVSLALSCIVSLFAHVDTAIVSSTQKPKAGKQVFTRTK